MLVENLNHFRGGGQIPRNHDAGNPFGSHNCKQLGSSSWTLLTEKGHFSGSEQLNSLVREILEITGDSQGRSIHAPFSYRTSGEGLFFGNQSQTQLLTEILEKLSDGNAFDGCGKGNLGSAHGN